MTEIEELLAQKKEIEAKIRAAKNKGVVEVDGAKVDVQHFSYGHDEWYIAVAAKGLHENSNRWRGVIRSRSRAETIAALPNLIASLQELQERLNDEGNSDI